MVLVSLYDSKAKTYTPPHPSVNEDTAIREFQILVNDDGKTQVSQYPEDFVLFAVGEWCDRVPVPGNDGEFTSKLVAYPDFRALARGIDLRKKD